VAPLLLEARVRACLTTARLREADRRGRLQLERELEIGREIQAGSSPRRCPRVPGLRARRAFEGARQVSGDFYDAFAYDEGMYTGVVVGDVCGKGVGAALFMALFRTLIRAVATRELGAAQGTRPFEAGGQRAHRRGAAHGERLHRARARARHMFATVFAAGLHPFTGALWYVNAGHEAGLILKPDGGVRAKLNPTGPALGLLPDLPFTLGVERLQPARLCCSPRTA
jgi:serine phosphatase RsbU (regulator of sigma subunit)